MRTKEMKTFNLDKKRPKVLVLGNGVVYGQSIPWEELIRKVCRDNVDISTYEEKDSNGKHVRFLLPNTVLTLATSDTNDQERHKKYVEVLNQSMYLENLYIKKLLELPFDAILTTNYTYEIETALNPRFPSLKPASKRKYAVTIGENPDTRHMMHTFNRVKENGPDIWHIHGELRCPSSMILSHDEYARHINQILLFNKDRGNDYEKYRQKLSFKSWVDYFLLGDVYMLGLSLDFSEFDLWWLLGRRLREKTGCGDLVFYEPIKSCCKIKQVALNDTGVSVETCGIDVDNGGKYEEFYQAAIEDIINKMGR